MSATATVTVSESPPRGPFLAVAIAIAIVTSTLVASERLPWWCALVALGALAGTIAYGVANVRSGVFLRGFHHGRRDRREIAFTFDDGPDPVFTPRVLAILRDHGVRATFFVVGKRVAEHPSLVADIVAHGHEIGVHTFHHGLDYAFRPPAWLRDDTARTIEVLRAAGAPDPLYFRPPNGLLNPRIAMMVHGAGLALVGWSVRPRDGVRTSADVVVSRVASRLKGGDVVLLHDGGSLYGADWTPAGVEALPRLLELARERSLVPVTVGELMALAAPSRPA